MSTLPILPPSSAMENSLPETSPPSAKPRVWSVFAIWLAAAIVGQLASILAFVVVGMSIGVVMGTQGASGEAIQAQCQQVFAIPLVGMLLTLLPFQIGMLLVTLLAARFSKVPLRERLGLLPPTGESRSTLNLVALGGLTLAIALLMAVGTSLLGSEIPSNPMGDTINEGSLLTLTIASIILSLVPVMVEEIVFRGYIQRRLLERCSPSVAIGISAVLFALLHADSVIHIIAVLPLGIITGVLAYRTNSVKPGMVVHAVHNAGVVAFVGATRLLTPVIGEEGMGIVVLAALAIMFIGGLIAVISLFRRSPIAAVAATPPIPIIGSLATQAA